MSDDYEERIVFANDEILEKGNFGAIAEVFSTTYVVHAGGKNYKGHPLIERFVRQLRLAIPNLRVLDVTLLLQSGDQVTWQRTLSGTHKADLMGIPPTGQKVEWRDMVVTRFDDVKIAEEWTVSELAGELLLKMPAI